MNGKKELIPIRNDFEEFKGYLEGLV